MDEQLRKKLEGAAEKITHCEFCRYKCDDMSCKELCADTKMTISGIELGYKEAIAQAKEWLFENSDVYGADKLIVASFEAYMRNLWEEQK